ncbi:MAG TPA: hypothetical protein VEK15_32095 [Vicinamibacteria bacterium]|nr:hypothetical protein [Vicinamibacteria bacterium]
MAQLSNPVPLTEETQRQFEQARAARALRPLTEDESGGGVERLPDGVYGFTYSPAEPNFPLFRQRDLRTFETHKLADSRVFLLGFLTAEEKAGFDDPRTARLTLHLFPEPKGDATHLVSIPMSRVLSHIENSARAGNGLALEIGPTS